MPVALSLRDNTDELLKLNHYVIIIQYVLFIFCFQIIVTAISFVLIPFAWIIGIKDKASAIQPTDTTRDIMMNLGLFILFGPLILALDTFADVYFFWQVMFKTKMKQIIIEREKSTINHKSLRQLMGLTKIFSENKIKSAHSHQFVGIFRENYKVM